MDESENNIPIFSTCFVLHIRLQFTVFLAQVSALRLRTECRYRHDTALWANCQPVFGPDRASPVKNTTWTFIDQVPEERANREISR